MSQTETSTIGWKCLDLHSPGDQFRRHLTFLCFCSAEALAPDLHELLKKNGLSVESLEKAVLMQVMNMSQQLPCVNTRRIYLSQFSGDSVLSLKQMSYTLSPATKQFPKNPPFVSEADGILCFATEGAGDHLGPAEQDA